VEVERIVSAFCVGNGDSIRADGRIVSLESPTTRLRLLETFHRQTAVEWLINRCRMSRQAADAQLKNINVSPDAPISTLAGNPRWRIGFVAAMYAQPAGLVFSTTGCDPAGIQQALQMAHDGLGAAAGVYVSCFPDVGVSEPDYESVVNLTLREPARVLP
jgi:hypothetical protein